MDLTRQGEPYDEGYLQVARDVWEPTTKPFCLISNLPATIAKDEVGVLREAGIPVLEGTVTGLRALKHLLGDATRRGRCRGSAAPVLTGDRSEWRAARGDRDLSEVAALSCWPRTTSPSPRRSRRSLDAAEQAAERIGYPVAIKTAMPGILHKSDVGAFASASRTSMGSARPTGPLGTARPEVTVAAMAPPGVEVALGIVRDPTFGPLVLVAAGGVLVEVLHDRKLALPRSTRTPPAA